MFAAHQYNTFETSLDNAKTVVGLELLYESVRKSLSKLMVVALVLLVGLPFVFFFGFWLQTKRKKFQKHMRKDVPTFNTYKGYLELKDSLRRLDELMPALKKVNSYNLKKAPVPIKYTLSQMQKMTSTSLRLHSQYRNHYVLSPHLKCWSKRVPSLIPLMQRA